VKKEDFIDFLQTFRQNLCILILQGVRYGNREGEIQQQVLAVASPVVNLSGMILRDSPIRLAAHGGGGDNNSSSVS
jgi:hypothetical protein